MLRTSLTLVLVLTLPALSGCLGIPFLSPQDTPEEAPGTDDVWLTVDPELGTSASDVYAFWVPDTATGVRVLGPPVEDDPDDRGRYAPYDAHRHLSRYDDRIMVFGPDGERLRPQQNTADDEADDENETGHDTALRTSADPQILFEATDPVPGRYTIVVHGDPGLPTLSLRLPRTMLTDTDAAEGDLAPVPLVTLPRAAVRHHLDTIDGTPVVGRTTAAATDGELPLPPFTLLAWGDMLGSAVDARLRLHTGSGDVHTVREPFMTRPPGSMHGEYGPMRFMMDAPPDPVPLRESPLRWSLDATGQASGFATILSAQDAPRPLARPVDLAKVDGEAVPFEGRIRGGEAGVVDLAEGTVLGIMLDDEDDPDRASRYRLYDLDGQRLGWGTVHGGETLGQALPAGPVVVVNDGRRDLALEARGVAPADATLYEAETRDVSVEVPLDTKESPAQARRPWTLPGPALDWRTHEEAGGTLKDAIAYVERDDAVVAQTPHLAETRPDGGPCCWFGDLSSYRGDPHWIDAGDHGVRISATAGSGTMTAWARVVDLAAMQALFAAPEDTEADPDGNTTAPR